MRSYDAVCKELGFNPNQDIPKQEVAYFGYAKGVCLGKFQSVADAKENGAFTTERSIVNEQEIKKAYDGFYKLRDQVEKVWLLELQTECANILSNGGIIKDKHTKGAAAIISYVNNRCQYYKDTIADYAIEECVLFVKVMGLIA